jgi:acetyl/propionyl-CoA carboxylase alpha subunit
LVKVAASAGADAVHPGYGYLSENAEFADAVRNAGLIFIGPSSTAMSTLGDKRTSKDYLRKHEPSVPLIPGFAGSSQNVEELEAAADDIGFPVMLKASAGGGGRGMRIVHERSKLREELATAQSEAARSFGSSDCILEKYIEAGKHVEVQIMGDSHGNVLSLWERECSVQRRHQKIIEETPSPFLDAETRQSLCATAVKIGQLLAYEGAGTVEFVLDVRDRRFYFLEVNTRLQVEHPITEEVTGLDAVSLQLYAAAGGNFTDLPQLNTIPQNGHAVECRLCAEDPQRNFMPEHGPVRLWRTAASPSETTTRDVRFETAVRTGGEVSIFFDSMIAKIVVWAPTRSEAIEKMVRIMAHTACVGVKTNQLFLQSCLLHPAFRNPAYTTSFIAENLEDLLRNPYYPTSDALSHEILILSAVTSSFLRDEADALKFRHRQPFRNVRRAFKNQPFDPVNLSTRVVRQIDSHANQTAASLVVWKSQGPCNDRGNRSPVNYVALIPLVDVVDNDPTSKAKGAVSAASETSARYNKISNQLRAGVLLNSPSHEIEWKHQDVIVPETDSASSRDTSQASAGWITTSFEVMVDGQRMTGYMITDKSLSGSGQGGQQDVFCHIPALGTWYGFRCFDLLSFCESMRDDVAAANSEQPTSVKAPMPCKVLSVLKAPGDDVKMGESVMVVESMKMEMNISMSAAGKFQCTVAQGDSVEEGKVLCWVE